MRTRWIALLPSILAVLLLAAAGASLALPQARAHELASAAPTPTPLPTWTPSPPPTIPQLLLTVRGDHSSGRTTGFYPTFMLQNSGVCHTRAVCLAM